MQAYQSRVSGPLLDRIDMQLWLPNLPKELLAEREAPVTDGRALAAQVAAARHRQTARQGVLNGHLSGPLAARRAPLNSAAQALLTQAIDKYRLSARSYHKTIKVAWTLSDLDQADRIESAAIAEALSYRAIDWERMGRR